MTTFTVAATNAILHELDAPEEIRQAFRDATYVPDRHGWEVTATDVQIREAMALLREHTQRHAYTWTDREVGNASVRTVHRDGAFLRYEVSSMSGRPSTVHTDESEALEEARKHAA